MKKTIMPLIALFAFSASATEICELGTQPYRRADGSIGNTVFISLYCTDGTVFEEHKSLIFGKDGGTTLALERDRIQIKKVLLDAGYNPLPECATYETYIKH